MRSRRARLAARLSLPIGLGLAPGCSSSPPALTQICTINSDCNAPLVCAFTHCHVQCTESRDCPTGQRCVPVAGGNDVCQLPTEATCAVDDGGGGCVEGETCGNDLQCRAPCGATATCLQAQICVNDQCLDPNNETDQSILADAGSSDGGSSGDGSAPIGIADAGSSDAGSSGDGSAPIVLATGQAGAVGIAVDGTSVYWTVTAGVKTMPLGGGPATWLAMSPGGNNFIRSDGTNVYWTSYAQGTVSQVAIAGGPVTTLASMQTQPQRIAVDTNNVYWTNWTGQSGGSVYDVLKGGGQPFLIDQSSVCAENPNGITSDGTNVYWVASSSGEICREPIGSASGPTEIATEQDDPVDIAVDAANLYWTNGHGSNSVMMLSLASTGPAPQPQMIATGQTSPSGIAIDEVSVYWANTGASMGSGSIAKVAIAGGAVVTVASGLSGPVSLAVDAQYVYWVNSADGSVMKAPK
jgi:hypothetical protein